ITDTGGGICVGHPVAGVEIAIIKISEQIITKWDDKLRLPEYEIGEIVVKGPQVSETYFHRKQASEHAKIDDAGGIRHRMGDLGYLDEFGKLWMCGRKAHAVNCTDKKHQKSYYSIPCERIFNTHPAVQRSALVAVTQNNMTLPLVCLELTEKPTQGTAELFTELQTIADRYQQTAGIKRFLIHPDFPVDVRHNAKIFREKLAVWAQQQIDK
ncbi:MAG: AMP-binding protein, partial [Psychromonas sp.]|nr:AMP-binding protein [Psychromonas sp.]